ncbi:hypothetical protein NE236_16715 [Actinoallomurus purpureus]|uniref:hypothetical protein n=1 Tax=Actinoallomurus purpureus TaxID=478114 RepID=UPI002093FF58|nr:hypothetical protein [Actinoallomurus purpureus]MCO6006629.1 hypothetical protein [Actinoallomurus purpureus]
MRGPEARDDSGAEDPGGERAGRGPESWYRRLLRAYPPAYRAAHGEEIVGTLLEISAGRRRPPVREAVGLIGGGLATRLRERTAHPAPWWADGLALGAFLIALANLFSDLRFLDMGLWNPSTGWVVGPLVIFLALLRNRLWMALPLALIEASQVNRASIGSEPILNVVPGFGPMYGDVTAVTGCVVMAAALLILAVGRPARPRSRSWWWLAALIIAWAAWHLHIPVGSRPETFCDPAAGCHSITDYLPLLGVVRNALTMLLLACGVWATAVTRDLRWSLAAALFLLANVGPEAYRAMADGIGPPMLSAAIWGVQALLVGVMVVMGRRGVRARA